MKDKEKAQKVDNYYKDKKMVKASFGFNIVLLLAVCFLGWKHYGLEKKLQRSHEENLQSSQMQFMFQGMLDQLPAYVEEIAREQAIKVFNEMNTKTIKNTPLIEGDKLKELLFEGAEPLDINDFFDYTPNITNDVG